MMPISLGTADFMVHHIHAFTIHVTALILLKGVLFARSSRLIPDKASLGFRFPCDGPGRGGTCQVSAWDHVFLGLFWMYNSISIVISILVGKCNLMFGDVSRQLEYLTLLVVTLLKVRILLMVGCVISYGRNLLKLFNHMVQHCLLMV